MNETTILSKLKVIKASGFPGPDRVPSIVLKNCSEAMAKPLHVLFNLSLSDETVAGSWKLSYLRPRFKSGKRSVVDNYRGIAKLSDIVTKLFRFLKSTFLFQINSKND